MTKFHLISDFHAEKQVIMPYKGGMSHDPIIDILKPLPEADILLIAGDTVDNIAKEYQLFERLLKAISYRYHHIFAILGNHEYYDQLGSISQSEFYFKRICGCVNNATSLINESVLLGDDIAIHGTTLWSDSDNLPLNHKKQRDFNKMRIGAVVCTSNDFTNVFKRNKMWIFNQLEEYKDKKNIVLTHHAPVFEGTFSPEYNNSPALSTYASDLSDIILLKQPKIWTFGHTHYGCDFMYGNTRIISNPVGYPNELMLNFNPKKVFEL